MSDNKTPEVLVNVERNGVQVPFVKAVKARGSASLEEALKKDPEDKYPLLKGQPYPSLQVTENNLTTVTKWIGEKIVAKILNGVMNIKTQGLWEELLAEAEGQAVSLEKFATEIAKLSGRGEKLSVLQEQLLDAVTRLTDMPEDADPVDVKELMQEIRSLKNDIASKKRKTREDVAVAETANA